MRKFSFREAPPGRRQLFYTGNSKATARTHKPGFRDDTCKNTTIVPLHKYTAWIYKVLILKRKNEFYESGAEARSGIRERATTVVRSSAPKFDATCGKHL